MSKELFQASFTDGQLDPGKVRGFVAQIVAGKPRHYVDILKNYHRLIRLELDKRHAIIESATQLSHETSEHVLRDLKSKYGEGLTTDFRVNPESDRRPAHPGGQRCLGRQRPGAAGPAGPGAGNCLDHLRTAQFHEHHSPRT